MSKEALAVALGGYTSLEESENGSVRSVDRLHGVAKGQQVSPHMEYAKAARKGLLTSLGVDVIRLTRCRSMTALPEAVEALAKMLLREPVLKLDVDRAYGVARQTLLEAASPTCPTCKGRRDAEGICSVPNGPPDATGRVPMQICPDCQGVGVRRFTNRDREEVIGCDPRKVQLAISTAGWMITEAVELAEEHGVKLVNRW